MKERVLAVQNPSSPMPLLLTLLLAYLLVLKQNSTYLKSENLECILGLCWTSAKFLNFFEI